MITAVMKSDHWAVDHKKMLDWAFANFDHIVVARKGDQVGEVEVSGGATASVGAVLESEVVDCVPKGSGSKMLLSLHPAGVEAPIQEGQVVGTAVYADATGYRVEVPVRATAVVAKASSVQAASSAFPVLGGLTGFALLGGAVYRARSRRSRPYGRPFAN